MFLIINRTMSKWARITHFRGATTIQTIQLRVMSAKEWAVNFLIRGGSQRSFPIHVIAINLHRTKGKSELRLTVYFVWGLFLVWRRETQQFEHKMLLVQYVQLILLLDIGLPTRLSHLAKISSIAYLLICCMLIWSSTTVTHSLELL